MSVSSPSPSSSTEASNLRPGHFSTISDSELDYQTKCADELSSVIKSVGEAVITVFNDLGEQVSEGIPITNDLVLTMLASKLDGPFFIKTSSSGDFEEAVHFFEKNMTDMKLKVLKRSGGRFKPVELDEQNTFTICSIFDNASSGSEEANFIYYYSSIKWLSYHDKGRVSGEVRGFCYRENGEHKAKRRIKIQKLGEPNSREYAYLIHPNPHGKGPYRNPTTFYLKAAGTLIDSYEANQIFPDSIEFEKIFTLTLCPESTDNKRKSKIMDEVKVPKKEKGPNRDKRSKK